MGRKTKSNKTKQKTVSNTKLGQSVDSCNSKIAEMKTELKDINTGLAEYENIITQVGAAKEKAFVSSFISKQITNVIQTILLK